MNNRNKYLLATLALITIAASFSAGWNLRGRQLSVAAKARSVRLGQYHFTNPLISCETGSNGMSGNIKLASMKANIEQLITRHIQSGLVTDVSVYFSDLNNDNEIEINGEAGFEPASLVKLPLMMEYFKRAENNPGVLTKTLVYDGKLDWTLDQNYRPQKTLDPGKPYTVEELIYRMVVNSDNNAFRTLLTTADRQHLQAIHNNLGVQIVADTSGAKLVTARSYAIFFKTLYNSSFLNQQMSEKALGFLSANEFRLGIDATIPDSIQVASKFGERTSGEQGEIKQLHDYGIVYYPNRPYLICIMTKGRDFLKLTGVIREISKMVFEEFDARYKPANK
jgi:beta-lactamase class A